MLRDREKYNAYMRRYMLKRYHRRMAEAKAILGGRCLRCGGTERLELDHVDPARKTYTLGKVLASLSQAKFQKELALGQLLCAVCHDKKTCEDRGFQYVRSGLVHGTLSSYKYCRCEICRKVWNLYCRDLKRKHRARSSAG